jgi:hypothetical protein
MTGSAGTGFARLAAGFTGGVAALGLAGLAKSGFPFLAASGPVQSGTWRKPIPKSEAFATPFDGYEPFADTYANIANHIGTRFAHAAAKGRKNGSTLR